MKVSVCLALYNGEKYLKEQVDSILGQKIDEKLGAELELVVSDDMSSDGSLDVLESYHDERIKIYRHKKEKTHKYNTAIFYATRNFMNAMQHATGDYIFLSDQDDVWHPHKMEKQLKVLLEQGGGVCAHSLIYMTEDGRPFRQKPCECRSFWQACKGAPIHGMSLAMSRDALDKILPIPDVPQHDIFITVWAKWHNCLHLIYEPLVAHRILANNSNASYSSGKTPTLVKVYYRLKLILYAMKK